MALPEYSGILQTMSKNPYTASAKKNAGRKSYHITFRHPLKSQNGKPGKKVCKGLGTTDESVANKIEAQLNELLACEDLHSVGSRSEAAKIYNPIIIEIFYGDLDPTTNSQRVRREEHLPLPAMETTPRTLILGNSGVGKTTLLRRLIGCDRPNDRFPATSTNRTTTCEIEILTGFKDYSAAVTFLTRNQTQQEVTEALSNALLKAIEAQPDEAIMKDLLDDTDQRFRLKYTLGNWNSPTPSTGGSMSFGLPDTVEALPIGEKNSAFLAEVLATVRRIATQARSNIEAILGSLKNLSEEDCSYALDEMQSFGENSALFQNLVSQIIEEIRERFDLLTDGKFIKSPTGWPEAWIHHSPACDRPQFLKAIRWFCSNVKEEWGTLLSPLVTGIRTSGPFRPNWIPENSDYNHVLIDTQGLDHEKTATELPSEISSLFSNTQNILFAESGKESLKSQSARNVMEAIAGSGHTAKLTAILTQMDLVVGDDIPTEEDRKIKAYSGLRSLIDNEVSRNVSRDAAKQLATHLEQSTFYLAFLDPKKYPENWTTETKKDFELHLGKDLWVLSKHLSERTIPQQLEASIPRYSFESLGLAVQEASISFQETWDARLGLKRSENVSPAAWQSIKAMSRRYAEGWFDGYWLRPIDNLIKVTRNVLTRFLESPLNWEPENIITTNEDKDAIINRLKQLTNDKLTELSRRRLWEIPQKRWQAAYEPSGIGSTNIRRSRIHDLLTQQVPIPKSISHHDAQQWVEEVKNLLIKSIEDLAKELDES